MLNMIAMTDPITVKNPFTPQAQGIKEGACLLMISMPVGKGMPNKTANGMIKKMASIIRAGIGKAMASLNNAGRKTLAINNKEDKAIMEIRSVRNGFILYLPEINAPTPVNSNSAESTIAKV